MINYNIYNQSTVVNSTQLTNIVKAINTFLTTLCNDWQLAQIQLVSGTYNPRFAIPNNTIFIFDDTDSPGALGYHFEDSGNAIGRVFAKTILNYGGVVLYRDNYTMTVAQCICHELLEMIGNNVINKWYLDNNGIFWAGELCDPVESNLIVYNLSGGVKVGLSDYVLPAWFSPDSKRGPYNKINSLRSPFSLDRGGYAIIIDDYNIVAVYGMSQSKYSANKLKDIQDSLGEYQSKFKFKSQHNVIGLTGPNGMIIPPIPVPPIQPVLPGPIGATA